MSRVRLVIFGIGFLSGLIIASLASSVLKKSKAAVEAEKDWLVCTHVNMRIIADAVTTYVQTNSTRDSMDLETLVRAKLLPEWSEIYICPAQYGITPLRSNYDDSFRSNVFSSSPIAANYRNCPYYIEALSNSFRVRCLYHTNALNFTVSKRISTNTLR